MEIQDIKSWLGPGWDNKTCLILLRPLVGTSLCVLPRLRADLGQVLFISDQSHHLIFSSFRHPVTLSHCHTVLSSHLNTDMAPPMSVRIMENVYFSQQSQPRCE